MRRPGIEPGSTAWKATMLTITPPTHVLYCFNKLCAVSSMLKVGTNKEFVFQGQMGVSDSY